MDITGRGDEYNKLFEPPELVQSPESGNPT
jgi:hypothetical protein